MKHRIAIVLLLILALAGCGGSGDNSGTATQLDPVAVSITRTPNGCLLSHNADAVVDYDYGVNPGPRNLLWNCANIAGHTRVGAEAFYIYDGAAACHVERSVLWKAGNCSARATVPANPLLAAQIEIVGSPSLIFIGGSAYAANVDVKVTNSGNITLFGPTVEIESIPLVFADLYPLGSSTVSGVGYLLPGESINHNGIPMVSNNVTSGQAFTFTARARVMVNDFVVRHVAATASGIVVAP
jgi:hypothetical protein